LDVTYENELSAACAAFENALVSLDGFGCYAARSTIDYWLMRYPELISEFGAAVRTIAQDGAFSTD
jgi:hypothetical protein